MGCISLPKLRRAAAALLMCLLASALSAQTAVPTSGQPVPSLTQLDTIMQQYMTQYKSPGASLSVTVDGRLIFARGYGYANTSTGEFVQPDSRMRLASNSKIITTVGILKLIEQGKLTLATKPFATILNDLTPPPGTTEDPRILNITIQNLLEHKAGYDDNTGYPNDPVNDYPTNRAAAANAGLTGQACPPKALISYELGVALQHDPGTTYAYSNLGYMTLGYIIERITGTPYATWIEQNIFPLANMTQTLPAGNLATDKLPYEVAYYGYPGEPTGPSMIPPVGTQVPYEYGGYDLILELANGGWTSTPMDLLRMWDTLNGQYSYNILSGPQSSRDGDIPPLGQGYYYTFYGSLPGTNSLVHLNTSSQVVGRVVYSAIFNTRDSSLVQPEEDADNAIQAYVQTVKSWPTGDLMPIYAGSGTACSFNLASTSAAAPMAGSTGTLAVTDPNYCAYSAVANSTWLHVTAGAFLNNSGIVGYTVDANTGAARTGTLTIAGQTLTVSQVGVATPTTLSVTGSATYTGTTETATLSAKLSPYSSSGGSTDGETVNFTNTATGASLGTAKLSSGTATFTGTIPYAASSSVGASYPGDSTFGASNSPSVTFTPTGTAATISPATLTFPSTPTGISSAAVTATLSNTGTTSLSLNLIMLSGPFTQTNNCGGSVAAGVSCTFSIVYKPTVAGSSTGTLDISDNAGDQTVSLSGTATAAAPVVTLNSASLTFPSTTVNTSSAAQTVTVTNTGNAPLTLSNIAAISNANQFTQTNNCTAASIPVNGTCTISVTFSPTVVQSATASLVLTDNASPAQQTVALSGTATAGPTPAVTLAPASLTFPGTQVASTSAPQTSILTNSGTAALTISSITASAGFSQTNTCPASLAANASCSISVTSTPTAVGPYTGSVSISTNATGSPQAIALSGTGAAFNAPTVTLSGTPATLTYGSPILLTANANGAQSGGSYTWSIVDGTAVLTSGVAYSSTYSYNVANPTAGTHSYTAVLSSTSSATYPTGTSNAVSVTVSRALSTSTFAIPAPISYGTALGTAQLAASSSTAGTFTYTPPAGTVLSAGTQPLSATLTPTDATDYSTSTASTSILVNKASLSAVAANSTRAYGAANPAFTGTLTGVVNADPITASYTSTAATTAAAGTTAPITASLNDPSSRLGNYVATLTPGTLTVTRAGSSVTLTGPANVSAGASVTFTATAVSSTSGVPTGTVTFASATGILGTGTLTSGVASLTVTLPNGTSTVTATYAGDTNFNGSASSAVSVVSGQPDYSVSATPSTASVTAGKGVYFTLTATPVSGYNTPITYSCSGLPAYAACFFFPATVTPAGAPVNSTLTLGTSVPGSASNQHADPFRTGITGSALATLLFLPFLRRRNLARFRRLYLSLLLTLLGFSAASLTGCADNSFNSTPTGTYAVTVNATSGTTNHSTVLTVTVQ